MLLCGIIDELNKSNVDTGLVSFFFCQATDSRLNNSMAVLRGLVYLLLDQQRSLMTHVRKKYDHAGKQLFEDANAWDALSNILTGVLQDSSLQSTFLIIDALDECETGLSRLLDWIIQAPSSSQVKWILSSRNRNDIERRLRPTDFRTRLSLELKENAEQVSHAVNAYIDYCISELPAVQNDQHLQDQTRGTMRRNANGTFLWVSLVFEELKKVESWDVMEVLGEVPASLEEMYSRMVRHIEQLERQNSELCRRILSTVTTSYRPLHLYELRTLSDLPSNIKITIDSVAKVVSMCGSFLTVRDKVVYFVHQSAREFLSTNTYIFPCGPEEEHYAIFSRSLEALSASLRRDMYNLRAPGFHIEHAVPPTPDPLAQVRYSCIYWIDHLRDWYSANRVLHRESLQDSGVVNAFLQEKFLYWLEALSLLRSMSTGVMAMEKLESLVVSSNRSSLSQELTLRS